MAKASKEPRISVLTFFNMGTIADSDYFGPLPELLSPDKPALYRKFTVPEFHENFYSKGLDSKSFIQKVRLWNENTKRTNKVYMIYVAYLCTYVNWMEWPIPCYQMHFAWGIINEGNSSTLLKAKLFSHVENNSCKISF